MYVIFEIIFMANDNFYVRFIWQYILVSNYGIIKKLVDSISFSILEQD